MTSLTTPPLTDYVPSPQLGFARSAAPSAIDGRVEPAIVRGRAARWLAENQEALVSSNSYVEQRGLPLARYRNF